MIDRVKSAAVKYARNAVVVVGIGLAGASYAGCGNSGSTESCSISESPSGCIGIYYEGAGCAKNEDCVCEKPKGAPDYECSCYCEDSTPKEPIDKGI